MLREQLAVWFSLSSAVKLSSLFITPNDITPIQETLLICTNPTEASKGNKPTIDSSVAGNDG